jgi:arylsulfatase A-like enzyme/Tfp pilus assembly protein PilF
MSRKGKHRPEKVDQKEGVTPRPRYAIWASLAAILLLGLSLVLAPRKHAPNLLLVTIDTLRADHLGAYGYPDGATPVLDGLAGRGFHFTNAHTVAPLTGPSHATILTGSYPPSHGVRDNAVFILGRDHPTLATLLKRRGYATGGFIAGLPLVGAFGFSQGFDTFNEDFRTLPVAGEAKRPGNEVADAVVQWLFLPRETPAPFDARFRGRPYDGEIAFADFQLGRILQALAALKKEQDTVVAVLADHGEGLGEHGEMTHAVLIYESTLRIPFILAGPHVPEGKSAEDVSTVDVVPTLLRLLGGEVPAGLPGRDLEPLLEGRPIAHLPLYSESLFGRLNCRWSSLRGLTEGRTKLILGTSPELYDLANDPGETRDLAAASPDRVGRLREHLEATLRAAAPQGDSARPLHLAPDQEERLRSLGYAATAGGSLSLDEPGLPDPRQNVQTYERLQGALLSQGPAAVRALEEARALEARDPQNPFATFTLASLAYRVGQLPLAAEAFSRTVALDPERPATRAYYGHLLRDMGRLGTSERELTIAVDETAADDQSTRSSLALTLIEEGKLPEAETLLGPIVKTAPSSVEVQEAWGLLLLAQGHPQDARPHLEQAAQDQDPERGIELALVHLDLRDPGGAERAAASVLARSPGHPWALAVSGHALVLEGRREEGVRALAQAVALHPLRPKVWRSLEKAFEAAGDRGMAARCRQTAEGLVPTESADPRGRPPSPGR